jgi:two-component system, cell cycle sensor histidine kinase and response regulator CckA
MTVFLVQDDLALAALTAIWLRALNFEVIVSNDGSNAGALASRLTGPIDLLLTDVMLTGMRGSVLAGAVRRHHPEMAVLFTSGYSGEPVGEIFPSHIDTALLLHKPYTADQLASGVRLALARRATSSHPRPPGSRPEVAPDPIVARRS